MTHIQRLLIITGISVFLLTGCIEEIWRVHYQATEADSITFEKHYVSTDGQRLYAAAKESWPNSQNTTGSRKAIAAFDNTGELRWQWIIEDDARSTGSWGDLGQGSVFAEDLEHNLYAVFKRSQNTQSSTNVLYKFTENGDLVFQKTLKHVSPEGTVFEAADSLHILNEQVFISVSGQLLSYNLQGELLWHFEAEPTQGLHNAGKLQFAGENTLIFLSNNYLSQLDLTGHMIQQVSLASLGFNSTYGNPGRELTISTHRTQNTVIMGNTATSTVLITLNTSLTPIHESTIADSPIDAFATLASNQDGHCFLMGNQVGMLTHSSETKVQWQTALHPMDERTGMLYLKSSNEHNHCYIAEHPSGQAGVTRIRMYDEKGDLAEDETLDTFFTRDFSVYDNTLIFSGSDTRSEPRPATLIRLERREVDTP